MELLIVSRASPRAILRFPSLWSASLESAELSDFAGVVTDELELRRSAKRSTEEKDLLFREVHHRVRNNLQVVASLLAVQSRSAPKYVKAYLDASLRRVHSMGL